MKKKKAAKKKTGRKTKKDQMKSDIAAIAEIAMILVSHNGFGTERELVEAWTKRLTEVRDRWGMQL